MKISVLTSLYNCQRFLLGYFQHLSKIDNLHEVEVILLHNAPREEELAIIENQKPSLPPGLVKHIHINQRESLYASWNRGVELARGTYIAIWNVDDIRESDSLSVQARTLDDNPYAGMTYGDIIGVDKYGDLKGRFYFHPEYDKMKEDFVRSCYCSCFPMWRKSVHDSVGLFDEQLRVSGDFDFQIRLARQMPLVKAHKFLGYYLDSDPGKLTTANNRITVETTAVELRYGIFDKINLLFLRKALTFIDIQNLYWKKKKEFVSDWFPEHKYWLRRNSMLFPKSIWGLPRDIASALKNRLLLDKTGNCY